MRFGSAQVLITAATLAGAFYAATAATALALAAVNPGAASQMPIANGVALARAARFETGRAIQAAAEGKPPEQQQLSAVAIPLSTRTKALEAFRYEPLATDAVAVIALADASRDVAKSRSILQALHGMNKRDEAASLWLAQDAARRADIGATLRYFDEVLRTSSEARPLLLKQFAIATSDARFRSEMVRLIGARPPWADEFWAIGAETPQAATALADLRIRLMRSAGPWDKRADQKLANALVEQGQFALARRLYEGAAGAQASRTVVKNPDFTLPSMMPPVDWETYATGELGSEISPQDGVLAGYASKAPGGVVARQWITLTQPRYRLRVNSRIFGRGEGDSAALVLTCLETGNSAPPLTIDLNDGQTDRDFQVSSGCRNFWLDVRIVPAERSNGIDAEFDQISIVPVTN